MCETTYLLYKKVGDDSALGGQEYVQVQDGKRILHRLAYASRPVTLFVVIKPSRASCTNNRTRQIDLTNRRKIVKRKKRKDKESEQY